jgi:outer membrane protein assembly factor BamD (BamD/ComL family)
METGLYQKYAQQYPDSPKAPEALYNAVYRQGVVVTMYTVQEDRKRAQSAAQRTQALAQELNEKYPKTDFAARGRSIAFRVSQGIPIYGSDRD